jgi:hypothetical protein
MIVVHGVLTRVKKSCWVPGTINLWTTDFSDPATKAASIQKHATSHIHKENECHVFLLTDGVPPAHLRSISLGLCIQTIPTSARPCVCMLIFVTFGPWPASTNRLLLANTLRRITGQPLALWLTMRTSVPRANAISSSIVFSTLLTITGCTAIESVN